MVMQGKKLLDDNILTKILRRGVSEIIFEKELLRLLQAGNPLRLKMGFDPSRPDIHLGHVVGLRKLRQLQDLGHKVILIVGDWTAQIGDPSGESVTRPMLTHEEVMANAESYLTQFFRVVDKDRTETILQSEWFGKFTLASVIDLTHRFTLAQFLERDDFAKRYRANKPIAITEFLYPLLQAYDSVAIRADVEFGGTDQKFNLLVGRQLQSSMGQRPQQCFMMPLLVGTDGVQKMSKSLDNYIAVDDEPNEMYGKIMSIADHVMNDYFLCLTDVPLEELDEMGRSIESGSVNPMEVKKRLAIEITSQFHGQKEVQNAEKHFEQTVQRRVVPDDVAETGFRVTRSTLEIYCSTRNGGVTNINWSSTSGLVDTADLIWAAGLTNSKGEAKRLLSQNAVEVDGKRYQDTRIEMTDGKVIKVGRRRYVRLSDLDKRTRIP